MTVKPTKNSLSIRLTESVVFLRNNDPTGRQSSSGSPSMLRGLLTLEIVKPTRISSIELELQGKAATSWPEGIGSRRIEVSEEHKIFTASTVFFRAGEAPAIRRNASVGPGLAMHHDDDDIGADLGYRGRSRGGAQTPREEESISRGRDGASRHARHTSVDASNFQREFVSHEENYSVLPTPPYTPASESPRSLMRPTSSSRSSHHYLSPSASRDENPAHHLEEFRNALRALEVEQRNPSHPRDRGRPSMPPSMNASSASSIHSTRDTSLSRRPSIEDVPEDRPAPPAITPPAMTSSASPAEDGRGRKHARFSFANATSLLDAVKDRVRSSSPRTRERNATLSRERGRAGRSRDTSPRGQAAEPAKEAKDKDLHKKHTTFSKLIKGDLEKEATDGWKEFKKGIYTYPISFTIPANAPPTLECAYGSVSWRLKAQVHRPGTFAQKLSATRDVVFVACPGEDDTEDTENIIVERQWDSQLQYLISISGRSFYIGGHMPIQITMLPLTKAKVHRISVILEEKTEYYTQMKRIARSEAAQRHSLLSLKVDSNEGGPILPLISDDPEAFRNSPLYAVVGPDEDPDEVASSLMGPGPWTFNYDLALPSSCSQLHFTSRNKKSNIIIQHTLKLVFRVERGDDEAIDPKTGKRKLFDIVVQTPVHILSCRCNPEWTSLPRYTESLLDDSPLSQQTCPCGVKLRARSKVRAGPELHDPNARPGLHHTDSRQSTDSASTAESSPINAGILLPRQDSLYSRNTQFERLVSGQESEAGEAPPSYDYAASSALVR